MQLVQQEMIQVEHLLLLELTLFGNSQTEGAITGPNGAAKLMFKVLALYKTITSVTVAGGVLVGNVTVGLVTCVATATEAIYQLKSNFIM